jgi:hypothetical protein
LLLVAIPYLEETYIPIKAIDWFWEGIALALLIVSLATDYVPNIVVEGLATLHNLFEISFYFLYPGSICLE